MRRRVSTLVALLALLATAWTQAESETDGDLEHEEDEYSEEAARRCSCNAAGCGNTCLSPTESCYLRLTGGAALLGCVGVGWQADGAERCVEVSADEQDERLEIYLEAGLGGNRTFCCSGDLCNLQLHTLYSQYEQRQRRLRPSPRGAPASAGAGPEAEPTASPAPAWLRAAAVLVPLACLVLLLATVLVAVRVLRRGRPAVRKSADTVNLHVNLHLPLPGHGQYKCERLGRNQLDYVFSIVPSDSDCRVHKHKTLLGVGGHQNIGHCEREADCAAAAGRSPVSNTNSTCSFNF